MHGITNIQKYSIHDGDGIRTTVFFKGCDLRCAWCHNPETQRYEPEIQVDYAKCTGCGKCAKACKEGAIEMKWALADGTVIDAPANEAEAAELPEGAGIKAITNRAICTRCGRCEDRCVGNFRAIVGKDYTIKELVKKCMQDLMFYEDSGGGVTLSGGEVMAVDNDYVTQLCKELHRQGVSVYIDTCGYAPWENYENILPYVDTFMYDIKVMDDEVHKKYMGKSNALIHENLIKLAQKGARIYLRIPTIKEVNGTVELMTEIIDFLKANDIVPAQVNLLPYHATGSHKYPKLGRKYLADELTAPTDEEMEALKALFEKAGYNKVKIGG